jgi:hypothetical protein
MCFVVQWQLHASRALLRQDGTCVNMSPLVSASDAAVLRNIVSGPPPSLLELRANPNATSGECVVQSFKNCDAGQWLSGEGGSRTALKVRRSIGRCQLKCSKPIVLRVSAVHCRVQQCKCGRCCAGFQHLLVGSSSDDAGCCARVPILTPEMALQQFSDV